MQQHRRRIRLVRRFVLGLAVAAIVAPAAQARIPAPDSPAPDQGAIVQGERKSDLPAAAARPEGATVQGERKSDLPGAVYVPFVSDFPRTAPAPGGDGVVYGYRRALPQDYGVIRVEVPSGTGTFDWGDAFVGAGGAFALLLVLGGATLATRHVGRPAAA
jgi:hypothetical protein